MLVVKDSCAVFSTNLRDGASSTWMILDVGGYVVDLIENQSPAVSLGVVHCDVSESVGCFSIGHANLAFVLIRKLTKGCV